MMKPRHTLLLLFAVFPFLAASCKGDGQPDAYGIVGARSWMIAASEPGQIISLSVEEGRRVAKGDETACLDTAALSLQLQALEDQMEALRPTLPDAGRQLDVLNRQKESLTNERDRTAALVDSGAASGRQLDQLDDRIAVIESQIAAARSSLSRETAAVLAEITALNSQAAILRDRIARCTVTSPEEGTVTALYAHLHEFVSAGMPIFKLSDLRNLYVDAWLDGDRLARVALGDTVEVRVDGGGSAMRTLKGRISYIAEEAEFTPNQVMTRDTRTTMVYHVRIDLAEDPFLRPGMAAEIYLPASR